MIGSKREFDQMVRFLEEHECKTELQIKDGLNMYFDNIVWSLLKEEWLKLTEDEKEILVLKLFQGQKRKRGMGTN